MRLFSKLFLLLSLLAATIVSAETHPFSVHDMLAMDRISDAQVSPDGKTVVFVVRATDLAANRGANDLWAVGTDGTGLRRLTSHSAADVNPRWSPDGKTIYFLSTRSGSSQLWQISLGGGEATQVTSFALDVESFRVSPDGTRIAFSAAVFPGKSIDETAQMNDAKANQKASGKIYDSLLFRHWDTWAEGTR
ncbi:MAG TPA: LpqB family beta-propeller domain-containing protein, partial [Thermoanaerobaculia bacterium]